MGLFKFPYTDLHELNLDMILRMIKELDHEMDDFIAANKITNAGAWDITKQYQAWTIVSDNNAGYISLRPVPVGIDIHNTEYWGLIADYDILITDLSNRISDLETAVGSLERNTHNLIYKKYIFMSDSYGYHPSASTSWIAKTVSAMGLSASEYISWYEGSTGFLHRGLFGHTFKELAEAHESDITNPNYITDVILCAGTNDIYYSADYSLSDLLTAIDTFCGYIKSTYPNAKIHLGMCGNFIGKDATQRAAIKQMPWIYARGAALNGSAYIDNIEYVMHIYDNFDDAQHPNGNGAIEISNCVVSHLAGGSYDVIGYSEGGFKNYDSSTNINVNNKFYVYTHNGETHIRFRPSGYTIPAVTTPVDVPVMRYGTRAFGCPDPDVSGIATVIMEGFTTPIPVHFTFEIESDGSTGGVVKMTANNSTLQIRTGAFGYVDMSLPTLIY